MKVIYTLILLLTSYGLFANIRYVEVYDNIYNGDKSYDLDLDGDDDFKFVGVSQDYEVQCLKPTSFYANGSTEPKAYTQGAGMGTYTWKTDPGRLMTRYDDGPFYETDKYLMVKFSNGADVFYGWFLLDGSSASLIVRSYAYNDVPNGPIKPGETATTGIDEATMPSFGLTITGKNTFLLKNCEAIDKISVYSVDGRLVEEITNPLAFTNYTVANAMGLVMVAYYKRETLLATSKHFFR